ncbi:MAG: hypothetical protein NTX78_03685 [Rhodoluna sp.]|nr:hypothetical protein [Rhodoluna sp.]
MAKKTSFSQTPEPKRLGYWATKKIERQGRKDARKTQSVKDFSRTQAVNSYESLSQKGEMDLNDWLLRVTAPYIAGNARIEAEAVLLANKIKKAKAVNATTGRQKKTAAQRLAALEQEMADLRAQYAANRETGFGQIRRAEEAKPLWENFFNQKVSIYNRARAAKLKQSVDAVAAELPVYRVHDLVELEQFDKEFPVKDGDI